MVRDFLIDFEIIGVIKIGKALLRNTSESIISKLNKKSNVTADKITPIKYKSHKKRKTNSNNTPCG